MFYLDLKYKSKSDKPNNPGKSIPFSGHPKKVLDRKPLRFSTVLSYTTDFVDINLKPLVPVQPFGESKPCKIQGLFPGQATENTGNNQNTIQNDVLLIPPQSDGSEIPPKITIRFDGHFGPYQKPLTFDHINRACRFDMLIILFDFTILSIPSNRIYPTCYLLFFLDVLRCPFEAWPASKPLSFDDIKGISSSNHIQMTSDLMVSKNDKKIINLIYAPTFDNIFSNLSMTNHSLSIIFSHFLMFGNDKFYLHILSIYTYIKSSICIYNIWFYGLISALAQRGGLRGIRPPLCIYNKLRTYTYICTK